MNYVKDMKMLTLKRQAGDTFIVGDENIVVSIVDLNVDTVTLGFLSSPDRLVLKEEQIIPHVKSVDPNEVRMDDDQVVL